MFAVYQGREGEGKHVNRQIAKTMEAGDDVEVVAAVLASNPMPPPCICCGRVSMTDIDGQYVLIAKDGVPVGTVTGRITGVGGPMGPQGAAGP